jgi:hypothetical protein
MERYSRLLFPHTSLNENFQLIETRRRENMQVKLKKIPLKTQEDHYVDGLVSTGNKFPYTILKRIFSFQKNIFVYFINIWFYILWKSTDHQIIINEISRTGINWQNR